MSGENMTGNDARLFRSDYLNKNPILMEYLAKGALKNPLESTTAHLESIKTQEKVKVSSDSHFARRLRAAKSCSAGVEAGSALQATAQEPESKDDMEELDTSATIRRLLHQIDVLKNERQDRNQQDRFDDGQQKAYQTALSEIERLRTQNRNLFLLKDENTRLRHRVEDLEAKLNARRGSRSPREVLEENRALRARVKALETTMSQKRVASIPVIEKDYLDLDKEIEELVQRNAVGLDAIKKEIRAFERETAATRLDPQRETNHPRSVNAPRPFSARARYRSRGNLIGRSIETDTDVNDAKSAIEALRKRMDGMR